MKRYQVSGVIREHSDWSVTVVAETEEVAVARALDQVQFGGSTLTLQARPHADSDLDVNEVLEVGVAPTGIEIPEGLSPGGQAAAEAIVALLTKRGATDTGGCRAFYTPQEWRDRGEKYGLNSILIVVYDGGDVGAFFTMDKDYPQYKRTNEMTKALDEAGPYHSEECHCWYSAIYLSR